MHSLNNHWFSACPTCVEMGDILVQHQRKVELNLKSQQTSKLDIFCRTCQLTFSWLKLKQPLDTVNNDWRYDTQHSDT
jgi:hypothetical protein